LTHLLGALEREPQGFWVLCLKVVAQPAKGDTPLPPVQLLGAWNQACGLLEKAAKAAPKDKEVRETLELARQSYIAACLQAGRNLNDAQTIARRMLAETPTNDWNYGDVVYHAHSALGRIALRQGDRETARQELRAAGRTPGSSLLNSYGPRFVLVRELLEHGEPADREAVVAFLDDFARFWANTNTPSARPNQSTLRRQQQIETWKAEVRAGRTPENKTPPDIIYWP
jgi:tetratricopeptide (TPR) repeat protein